MSNIANGVDMRPEAIRKNGSLHPFKHANALFKQITDIHAQFVDQPHLVQGKLRELLPYESRGHGWKGRIKNRTTAGCWNVYRSKYLPHQSHKERAKRAIQALAPEHRATARSLGTALWTEELARREQEVRS